MSANQAVQLAVADDADFVRHFSGSKIDGDQLVAGALLLPPSHEGEMSINVLGVLDKELMADLDEIRQRSRLTLRKSGRYFRWNTAEFLNAILGGDQLIDLSVVSDPLLAEGNWPDDPSHALIVGVPSETLASDLMLDLVRPAVRGIYPALAPSA